MDRAVTGSTSQLARTLRLRDYFTLAFGTMVGVGWLVVMDDWLSRGGPGGAMLAFLAGGLLLAPIAFVYGRLVARFPDAGGEFAFARAAALPEPVRFATGWLMALAYLIVCPWEAVAIGRIAAYLVPALDRFPLYSVAGRPVFLPRVILGLALIAILGWINFRGIRLSATFQNWTTAIVLASAAAFVTAGFARGHAANLRPLFASGGMLVSTLLMLQVVPYYMTGFESVSKSSEEARVQFAPADYSRAIFLALAVGSVFYIAVIAVVGAVTPWQTIVNAQFATAVAYERAFAGRTLVHLIFIAAIASLIKIYNGNLVAGTRVLFAMARAKAVPEFMARLHPRFATPSHTVVLVSVASAAAIFLGDAVLVPISEVGSLASACGWLAACLAFVRLERSGRAPAVLGLLVALALALMKLLPFVPGHFRQWELIALAAWLALGVALRRQN